MLKNNAKEFFIVFICTLLADIVCMLIFYYLRKNGIMFTEFDIARYTTVAIVFTGLITAIVIYKLHKKKDDTFEAVTVSTIISLIGAFFGSISGAVIAANLFGRIT